MELKNYQSLTGNTDIVKYEVVIDKTNEETRVYKNKCLVLADTKAMIALAVEDDPETIVCVGVGIQPENVCLVDKIGYPHAWESELDGYLHCEMYTTFDEETTIDMIKNTIMLELEKEITDREELRNLTSKL